MTAQIDTTAETNGVRLVKQGTHPSTPSSGHVLLYYVTGTASPGLYIEDDAGRTIGPYITGSSGGSGLTVQYPGLKPATPTYDFADAALDGAFTARSNQGSFSTSNVITQAPFDFPGSAIAMMFSNQMGGLYVAHGNGDLDFHVGGFREQGGFQGTSHMFGIAALDSSGSGVCVTAYTDGNAYMALMVNWAYSSQLNNIGSMGLSSTRNPSSLYWMRLKRISGTWTAYISQSGRTWDSTFSTASNSYTIDKLYFGMIHDASVNTYKGILTADYFQVDV